MAPGHAGPSAVRELELGLVLGLELGLEQRVGRGDVCIF
jgi:hypothetical protein